MKTIIENKAIIIYLVIYGLICLFVGFLTNFHVYSNDFWGNLFMAEHLDISQPESFYNGFFPLGYAVYLRLFSFGDSIISGYLTNILLGLVMLGSIAYLGSVTVGPKWALFSTIILSILPKIFPYITIPGPDIGTAAFITLGGVLLICSTFESDSKRSMKLVVCGGILCGLAAMWRYHGLVLGLSLILSTSIFSRRPLYSLVLGLVGFFFIYSIQIFFNVLSGHGLFETSTAFNVYKLIYDINWHKVSSLKDVVPTSILGVILFSTRKFLLKYQFSIQKYLPLFIPSLSGIFLLKERKLIEISMVISQVSFLYIIVVVMGDSSRVIIPLLPLIVYQIIVMSKFIYESALDMLKNSRRLEIVSTFTILIIVVGILSSSFLHFDFESIKVRKTRNHVYRAIQERLIEDGDGRLTNSRQVFTTDFDLYFPDLKFYRPITNGGWGRYSLFGFNEENPELSTRNIDEFIKDCYTHNIVYIVLSPNFGFGSDELSKLYYEELELKQFEMKSKIGLFKIYKVIYD